MTTNFDAIWAKFAYITFIRRAGVPKQIGRLQRRCEKIKY